MNVLAARTVEPRDKQHRERGISGFSAVNFAEGRRSSKVFQNVKAEPRMN